MAKPAVAHRILDWEAIARLLEAEYGSPRHGNPTDPTDCLLYLMLSRKTPITAAMATFERLKAACGEWDALPGMSPATLRQALEGTGLETIRGQQMQEAARTVADRLGTVNLCALKGMADEECVQFLCGLPGVGLKTAYCVMMYTLGRAVFPADAHCIRIAKRLGVIPEGMEHRAAQRVLGRLVPPGVAYTLHVNLVAHGKAVCRAGRPYCEVCVVAGYCRDGRETGGQAMEARAPERRVLV